MKAAAAFGQAATVKKVLQYIRHYRIFLLLSVLCAAVSVALTLYSPILIGAAVDQVLGPGQVNFPAVGGISGQDGDCDGYSRSGPVADEYLQQ